MSTEHEVNKGQYKRGSDVVIHCTYKQTMKRLSNNISDIIIDGFRRCRGRPTVDHLSILVDQEHLKIPLKAKYKSWLSDTRSLYLDTGQTQKASFLFLQPFVNFVGVVTIYIRLLHQGECYTIIDGAKALDLFSRTWFLVKLEDHELQFQESMSEGQGYDDIPDYKGNLERPVPCPCICHTEPEVRDNG